eukprot:scaffold122031_cov51-Phaeocystis_antarctica.AAC.1
MRANTRACALGGSERVERVERVELDGAGATDRRSTALDPPLDPDGVERLDVLDVGRLHVGVDEEEQGGLGAEDQHDVLRRVAARGPDVKVEMPA